MKKIDINILHAEIVHHFKVITHETGMAMDVYLTGIFHPCEDCALREAKKSYLNKTAVEPLIIFRERLFFNINYWLLIMEDGMDFVWSYFLEKKLKLANKMLTLIKNLKTKYVIQFWYTHCDNAGHNLDLKGLANRKGWVLSLSMQP